MLENQQHPSMVMGGIRGTEEGSMGMGAGLKIDFERKKTLRGEN
jgi:hypothetical protein